ncbi:hypothetical protein [Methanoregula sp.]|jgi:hypothetical protein|uniref:hypothetical protein n=1 Tax=Methanoregula sp. TaxID=2052170 RepID=UPI0035673189
MSEEEQKKIWELHQIGYFPSVIARHLSDRYAHLNGGFRSVETVKDTIKMMEQRQETMGAAVPEELPDLSEKSEPVAASTEPEPVPKKKIPDMRKGNGRKR